MASTGNKTRNNLIVGIQNNYRSEAARSVSPVMKVSTKEEYELKVLSGKDRKHAEGDESHANLDTEFIEPVEETGPNLNAIKAEPNLNGIRTVSVTSNGPVAFNISDIDSEDNDETRDSRMSSGSGPISMFAGSASSSGRSRTPSHTSVHNEEYELDDLGDEMEDTSLDYFCVDHMQLCSMKAINENHEDCKNVVSAIEWAEEQQCEKDRKTTESLLQKFDTFAGIMIDERKELKRRLTERKEDVTEEALELMEDLVTHLLKKQKEFTEKFDKIHEAKMKIITDQVKRCTMVQKETSACMRQLAVSW